MNNLHKLSILGVTLTSISLSSCAPVPGPVNADLNGDGKVTTAEHNAFYKNSQPASANQALRQTRNALWDARSIKNAVRYW